MKNIASKPDFQQGDVVKYKMQFLGGQHRVIHKIELDENGDWRIWYTSGGFDYPEAIELVLPRENKQNHNPIYKILEAKNNHWLSLAVNKAMTEGFEPIGGVTCSGVYYMQAMLKR